MKRIAAVITLLAMSLRFATFAGATEGARLWLREITADGNLALVSLTLGFGGTLEENPADTDAAEEVFIAPEISPVPSESAAAEEPDPQQGSDEAAEAAPSQEILPTTIYGGLTISNATSFTPDIPSLMAEGWGGTLSADGVQILIIHTHGSEAYAPDGTYVPSDTGRTQDKNYNIVRVGDELAAVLEGNGLRVLHDREIYDYPSYSGSYNRSMEAIEGHLREHPEISVVIDVHRDALGSDDVVYKTVADIEGEVSAQLMMLVGTGENGLDHPAWDENLKLALTLQSAVNQKYPTLARPLALKQERYNQHLTAGSMILEVGSSGNTLSEALRAVRLYADAISPVLTQMIEN